MDYNDDNSTGFTAIPKRYDLGDGREAIDVIREELGDEAFVHFCQGTVLGYKLRAGKKGPIETDLEKLRFFQMMIDHVLTGSPDPRSYRVINVQTQSI